MSTNKKNKTPVKEIKPVEAYTQVTKNEKTLFTMIGALRNAVGNVMNSLSGISGKCDEILADSEFYEKHPHDLIELLRGIGDYARATSNMAWPTVSATTDECPDLENLIYKAIEHDKEAQKEDLQLKWKTRELNRLAKELGVKIVG